MREITRMTPRGEKKEMRPREIEKIERKRGRERECV